MVENGHVRDERGHCRLTVAFHPSGPVHQTGFRLNWLEGRKLAPLPPLRFTTIGSEQSALSSYS